MHESEEIKADWERNEARQSLTREEAQTLLGTEVVALDLIAEGRANTNFRVETPSGPLLLRLHYGADHEAALAERLRASFPSRASWIAVPAG